MNEYISLSSGTLSHKLCAVKCITDFFKLGPEATKVTIYVNLLSSYFLHSSYQFASRAGCSRVLVNFHFVPSNQRFDCPIGNFQFPTGAKTFWEGVPSTGKLQKVLGSEKSQARTNMVPYM